MWLHYTISACILIVSIMFDRNAENKVKKGFYIKLMFGLFIVLSAFRSIRVGNDTPEYIRLFNEIAVTGDISKSRYEMGYLYLNKFLSLISSHSQVIIIATSVIIMLGFARFIYKYSNNVWLSVYLFFTMGYFGMSMNTIRLNIAIVIILFSYDFLTEKKLFQFVSIVLLASLFHITALIFLLAWPITKLKVNFNTISFLVVGSLALFFAFPIFLQVALSLFPNYQYYLGSSYLDGSTKIASVMNFLVDGSIVLLGISSGYFKKPEEENTQSDLFKSNGNEINYGNEMLPLLLASLVITFISFKFSLLDRAGDYFAVFTLVYLPNSINYIHDRYLRLWITYSVVVLFFAYATTILIVRPEWNVIYPYSFFWN